MIKIFQVLYFAILIIVSHQSYCQCSINQIWDDKEFACRPTPINSDDAQYVANCQKYTFDMERQFKCSECQPSYYLDQNTCIQTNITHCYQIFKSSNQNNTMNNNTNNNTNTNINNLVETNFRFLAKKDESKNSTYYYCESCQLGYYRNYTKLGGCIQNPQETEDSYVKNCTKYTQQYGYTACKTCAPKFYLKVNECIPYPDTSNGCIFYQYSQGLKKLYCSACGNGFILKEDQCIDINDLVPNCASGTLLPQFNNIFSCSFCKKGFYLKSGAGFTQECKANPTKDQNDFVESCEIYQNDPTAKKLNCNQCMRLFYLNNQNQCKPVEKTIENCQYYKSPTTCSSCDSSSRLRDNNTKCLKCSDKQKIKDNNAQIMNVSLVMYALIIFIYFI